MASFERSIDVNVPVAEAYLLFSDFESFPNFMEGSRASSASPTTACAGTPASAAATRSGWLG